MNELLQKHGCSTVFTIPEGLKELMSDISREVLRDQPANIFDYIANYLSVLLITREHGILAVKILEDLCDCRASVSEHLLQLGLEREQTEVISQVIKDEIEGFEPVEGNEKIKETEILQKILTSTTLDEDMSAKVCQVARNAYRDYWYRKKLMEKSVKVHPEEPWEIAAEHTLQLYKRTKPSLAELNRATQKIQAAYRGYHVRRNILRHLKPKIKKTGPKKELPGPPLDIAESREMDLGRVIDIQVREDDLKVMFDSDVSQKLGLNYDSMRTITQLEEVDQECSEATTAKSVARNLQFQSAIDVEAKQSIMPAQTASQIAETEEATSGVADSDTHRISFAEFPPEEISFGEGYEFAFEEGDEAEEVEEEIPDDRSEGFEASVQSSAPMSDIEEAGDPTSEEGEE